MNYVMGKIGFSFLFVFIMFTVRAGNDTLTFAQAFDWCVGDTFVYYSHQIVGTISHGQPSGESHIYSTIGFFVLNRTDSGDSIIYSIDYFDSITPVIFVISNKQQSTFASNVFADLYRGVCSDNDLSKNTHILYYDANLNNLLTDTCSYIGSAEMCSTTFVEKVGIRNHYYNTGWQSGYFICKELLIKYVSACTGLVYNSIQNVSLKRLSFQIFPNPASNIVTIDAEITEHFPVVAKLYDVSGMCVRSIENLNSNYFQINLNNLSEGCYYLEITDADNNSGIKKLILLQPYQ